MCPMSLVFVASRLFNKFNLVFECNFWSHVHYFVCITLFDSTYFCLRCFFLLRSSRCFSPALCCSWVNTGKRLKWKCKNLIRPKKFKETKIKGVGPIRSIHGNNKSSPKVLKEARLARTRGRSWTGHLKHPACSGSSMKPVNPQFF